MKIEKFVPSDFLKPFVKNFLVIESESGTENRILPDASIVLAFRFRGSVSFREQNIENALPASVITGIRKSPRVVTYLKNSATLLVVFNEGGAAALFDEPLHVIFGRSVSLDDLVRRRKSSEIEEQLAEAKNNRQRIFIVERFLVSELKQREPDRLILGAIQKIKSENGNVRIKDLVKIFHISRDPFEKRFRRTVGTSPKQFAAIVRFRNLIDNRLPLESLTDAALAAGYFDQAHFIKDFKQFTGQTPQAFFKSSRRW